MEIDRRRITELVDRMCPGPREGRSWKDRSSLLSALETVRPLARAAVESVANAALPAAAPLRKGASTRVGGVGVTLLDRGRGGNRIAIGIDDGPGQWRLDVGDDLSFALRRETAGSSRISASGTFLRGQGRNGTIRIGIFHGGSRDFADLTALAVSAGPSVPLAGGLVLGPVHDILSMEHASRWQVARAVRRGVHERVFATAAPWLVRLLSMTAAHCAANGVRWGERTLRWTFPSEGGFPTFGHPTNHACLLACADPDVTAIVFRDAQPYIETSAHIVWTARTGGAGAGSIHAMPIPQDGAGDVDEFIAHGGVAAASHDFATGETRVTERAMSSGLLPDVMDHVGEAWSVAHLAPLYSPDGGEMYGHDFSPFSQVEPWTIAGGSRPPEEDVPETETAPHP